MNEITIASLEARYQALLRDLQIGRIDQAAFISAADDLYFQDGAGRCWAIGLQSGEWYYHDGQAWWPADPRLAERLPDASDQWQPGAGYQPPAGAELGPDPADERPTLPGQETPSGKASRPGGAASHRMASLLAIPAKSLLMAGAMFVAILALLALPAGGAPPASGPAIAPSPRPPLGGQGSGDGGGGGDGEGATGAIVGTVTDLSTGGRGEGIQVAVRGYPPVRTDSQGRYSITGLPAAEYSVSMQLDGQATPARGPVFVLVDGWSSTTVDLAYYSQGQPLPAETPQPEMADQPDQATAPPPDLPQSGAPAGRKPLAVAGLGLALTLTGGMLRFGLRQL